jgi:hypothetical protein
MDDEQFFNDVAVLTEASRVSSSFAAKVMDGGTDEQLDALVIEARAIVDEAANEA